MEDRFLSFPICDKWTQWISLEFELGLPIPLSVTPLGHPKDTIYKKIGNNVEHLIYYS